MASSYSPQRLLKRDRSSKRSLSRDKPELQKQSLKFRSTYSKKDFQIAEEIISQAEKIKVKANNKKGSQQAQHSKMLSLSDIIEGYNKVMAKIGIDTNRENRYYSMMVKLSINQKGKTWREALNLEYKRSQMNVAATKFNKLIKQRKYLCQWIQAFIQKARQNPGRQSHFQSIQLGKVITPFSNFTIDPRGPQIFTAPDSVKLGTLSGIDSHHQVKNSRSSYNQITGRPQSQTTEGGYPYHNTTSQENISPNPQTLEQSYRKRKREKALLFLAKIIQKTAQEYTFAYSMRQEHTQKAFQRWKSYALTIRHAVQDKERFINHWFLAYEHYRSRIMRKSYEAIAILGKYLRQTDEKELALRSLVETRLSNAAFYQWIDSYNQRIRFRQQLFKANQHWARKTMQNHLDKLRLNALNQRENKFKYRNFFLVKCMLEIMKRNVPRELYAEDTETYEAMVRRLIEIRRLKRYNEEEVQRTIFLFEMQVKAAIFQQIKKDYELISQFKAQQGMKIQSVLSDILQAWKQHLDRKNQLRDIQESFHQQIVVSQYSTLLKVWQQYSHKCQTLKKRFQIQQHQKDELLRFAAFDVLYEYTHDKKIIKQKTNKAIEYHASSLVTRGMVSLYHFRKLSIDQKRYTSVKVQIPVSNCIKLYINFSKVERKLIFNVHI